MGDRSRDEEDVSSDPDVLRHECSRSDGRGMLGWLALVLVLHCQIVIFLSAW